MKPIPETGSPRKKVLIVDDHPLLRDGLAKVINQQPDLTVCGEAADVPGGLAALARCRPDVAIVDLSLDNGSGLDLIKDIHARQPRLPVLVLSMHHENLYAERAVRAGARGYVMKHEPVAKVIEALHKVLAGHMALSEEIVSRMLGAPGTEKGTTAVSPAEILSDRELEVFRLLGEGIGTRQIAARFHVAASTVETHRANIKQKLNLRTATELVTAAARFQAEQSRT
jgi:DNA-binding NarL/FixJ family response regulator